MIRSRRHASLALFGLTLAACAGPLTKPLVDPFPLRFPLTQFGSLEIEGHVVGQPQARDGVLTFATDDGFLTAVVVPSRSVLWRKETKEGGPAAGGGSSQAGPETPILRVQGDRLRAFDAGNTLIWEFATDAPIAVEPAVGAGRVYFGTEARRFYCLKAATGKILWSRRLQGAPLHRAIVRDRTVAVPASNSVVYFLSVRGGSILAWEKVPSRVVYGLAAAGPLALVSSASPEVMALEIKTGRRVGQYQASGPLAAGAIWSPPYVVLFIEDAGSGRQRIAFLRSR